MAMEAVEPGSTAPPLHARLDARREALDPAYRREMNAAIAHLRANTVAERGRRTSDRAPDFALPDEVGRLVSLYGLLADGPVVLSFFRGEWCPFCRLEMDALIEAAPAFEALGARLVLVSPQAPTALLLARGLGNLTILRDGSNGVGLTYGLVYRIPDGYREALLEAGVDLAQHYGSDAGLVPVPATYLVDRDGVIAFAHVEADFTERLEPASLLALLHERSRTIVRRDV